MTIKAYQQELLPSMIHLWNTVVAEGLAFPQDQPLTMDEARNFFSAQTFTGVALVEGHLAGLYILHPNNVGRCGHIANTSYAVSPDFRGRSIGEALVRHSLDQARICGFRILQFNAVVASNTPALKLYEKLGFTRLGVIPGGFLDKTGQYQDIIPHYKDLLQLP